MVCNRCIEAVQKILLGFGLKVESAQLGEVVIFEPLSRHQLQTLNEKLLTAGFSLLEDPGVQEVEKIKTLLIQKIETLDIAEDFLLSKYLTEQLPKDYSSISRNFSSHENLTLEQYFILQKIEKTKELLSYNEFSLTEISLKLGYKSVQHLSSQFKTVTKQTPSAFKKLNGKNRVPLDHIAGL